jgi:type II secretory pathway component PulM
MHKASAQIASIHQESVDYALLVLRETTRQLFLLDVPFSQILKTLGEVNEQERSEVHATPRLTN